jgi:putative hydrolase
VNASPPDPIATLRRIAFLLVATGEPSFRSRVFRRAARTLGQLTPPELAQTVAEGRLREMEGIGPVVERIVREVLADGRSAYLTRLEEQAEAAISPQAMALFDALRGDCHTHSDWSDGRVPIEAMAVASRDLGHAYHVLTDHSPRLTIAHGLTAERLADQLGILGNLNPTLAPFQIVTGIEVDILADGALDQNDDLLSRLEVVVGSVHSLLRQPGEEMTPRMLRAIENPHLDILGHCTGRIITGSRGRPESEFDAEAVFAACARYDKAVEINCSPSRLDPPRRLSRMAVEAGCRFAINTDAHVPEELEWQLLGCLRAAECGVPIESVVNTWRQQDLVGWAKSHQKAISVI